MTPKTLPLADLARRCREETLRFLRAEPRDDQFCFELFERAIARREHQAWEAIMGQYRGIVLAYVGQHSAAAMVRESDDYWVNRAFQRFWMVTCTARLPRTTMPDAFSARSDESQPPSGACSSASIILSHTCS